MPFSRVSVFLLFVATTFALLRLPLPRSCAGGGTKQLRCQIWGDPHLRAFNTKNGEAMKAGVNYAGVWWDRPNYLLRIVNNNRPFKNKKYHVSVINKLAFNLPDGRVFNSGKTLKIGCKAWPRKVMRNTHIGGGARLTYMPMSQRMPNIKMFNDWAAKGLPWGGVKPKAWKSFKGNWFWQVKLPSGTTLEGSTPQSHLFFIYTQTCKARASFGWCSTQLPGAIKADDPFAKWFKSKDSRGPNPGRVPAYDNALKLCRMQNHPPNRGSKKGPPPTPKPPQCTHSKRRASRRHCRSAFSRAANHRYCPFYGAALEGCATDICIMPFRMRVSMVRNSLENLLEKYRRRGIRNCRRRPRARSLNGGARCMFSGECKSNRCIGGGPGRLGRCKKMYRPIQQGQDSPVQISRPVQQNQGAGDFLAPKGGAKGGLDWLAAPKGFKGVKNTMFVKGRSPVVGGAMGQQIQQVAGAGFIRPPGAGQQVQQAQQIDPFAQDDPFAQFKEEHDPVYDAEMPQSLVFDE